MPLSDPIVIVAAIAVLGPLSLAYLNARTVAGKEKRDYARADLVEKRIAERARTALAQQEAQAKKANEAAAKLLKSNDRIAEVTIESNKKLDVVHVLVNSQMTTSMQSEMDALTLALSVMNEVVEIKRATAGYADPSQASLQQIKLTEDKIALLRAALDERRKSDELAAEKVKTAALEAENEANGSGVTAATERLAAATERVAAAAEQVPTGPVAVRIAQPEVLDVRVKDAP